MISKGVLSPFHSSLNVILLATSLFLFLTPPAFVLGEVYSSASDMREVFHLEKDLVHILDEYASKLTSKLDRINNYLRVRDAICNPANPFCYLTKTRAST